MIHSLGIIGDGSNLQDKIQEIPAPERRVQVFNWFRIFQPEQPAHPNEPFYYCPATSCAVPFSSHPELLEHIVMCAKLEEGSYYCQICSKDERFAWPKELQQQLPKRVYSCAKRTSKFIKRLRLPKLLIPSSPVIAPTSSAPTSSSTDASTQELDTQKTSSHFFASSHELESCKTTPWPSHSHELPAQLSKSQAETHLELTGSDVRMELPGYYTPAELPERRSQWEQIATRVHERIDPISRFVDDVQPSSKMSEVMLTEELPLLLDVDEQVSPVSISIFVHRTLLTTDYSGRLPKRSPRRRCGRHGKDDSSSSKSQYRIPCSSGYYYSVQSLHKWGCSTPKHPTSGNQAHQVELL